MKSQAKNLLFFLLRLGIIKTTLLFIIFFNISKMAGQLQSPFLETFDDVTFHNPGPFSLAGMSNTYGDNYEINDEYHQFGKYLSITIHPDDHYQNADSPRSRAEMLLNLENEYDKTYYYSWKMFIPTDTTKFKDDTSSGYHIINQILTTTQSQPNSPAQRKILSMDYIHEDIPSSEPRDLYIILYDIYDTSSSPLKLARINISDAIMKGEWNEIMYKIHWSENDSSGNNNSSIGSFEFFINGYPLICPNPIESGNTITYNCGVSNSGNQTNIKFVAPNNLFTNGSNPDPVYNALKLGHYRKDQNYDETILLDDFRITDEFPSSYNKTRIIESYCNNTLPIDNMTIKSYEVPDATHYIFKFQNNGETNYVGNGTNTILDLSNLSFIEANTTYDVYVRAQRIVNGVTEFSYGYGDSCQITAPHLTKLKNERCDVTLPSNDLSIRCFPIPNATHYVFKFKYNGNTSYVGNGPNTTLDLSNLSFIEANTTYDVYVRAQRIINGVTEFSYGYGDGCSITIPNSGSTNLTYQMSTELPSKPTSKIVYPNPFNDLVYLPNNEDINSIRIFDLAGGLVYETDNLEDKQIDLSFIGQGVYILNLYSNSNRKRSFKIIKN